ncbi:hypothetical protein [Bradyrhizobium diazoefficiens]
MSHVADKGKFYKQPTVRHEWLRQIQAKTYCGRRSADHDSRQLQPLDPIDLHVAMRLLDHLNRETGRLDPAHATIAAALGVSVSTVWRSMDRLAEHNFLKATERFRNEGLQTSNQYDLNLELAGHDATSSVTHPVLRRRRTRRIIGDVPGTSSMTDEPQRMNLGEKNPGEENHVIPERFASGTSDLGCGGSAFGADRHEKPWSYKQTKVEADQAFERLERMPWKKEADDPAFRPSAKAAASARIHWHNLLKSEIAAWRIERAAERLMTELREAQRPGLAGFLARYASQCVEPGEWLYIPDDEEEYQAQVANDNQQLYCASGEGSS